jgi:branched-chain amino acid transport system ATP-binding protein
VRAIRDVSFDIRKGEVRAIIGPNGAGKTSMLNVINGFYQPQQAASPSRADARADAPYDAARGGIARTFQNVALFKGMSALDNIMAGRTLKMKHGFLAGSARWPALSEEIEHRHRVEEIIDFPRDPGDPQGAGARLPVRSAEARRARPGAGDGAGSSCCSTSRWPA